MDKFQSLKMPRQNLSKTDEENDHLQNSVLNQEVSISMLNDDCMRHILSFLSFKTKLRLQRVCKSWQALMPWDGVKELKLQESKILCDSEYISEFSLCSLRKVLDLCGFSITDVDIHFFQSKELTNILELISQLCPKVSSFNLANFPIHID